MPASRSLLAVALLAILWLPGYARSATYYVAQEAPNASDENPGSEGEPWKTLAHAAKQVQPRDILFVKAGTYREMLHLTADQVSVRAFGDDAVVITRPESEQIDPASWRAVPDSRQVYECKTAAEGKILIVDGRAIHFEKTQGVQVNYVFDLVTRIEKGLFRTLGEVGMR